MEDVTKILKMHKIEDYLSSKDDNELNVFGKNISAKELKVAISEPIRLFSKFNDSDILTFKGSSFTVREVKHHFETIISRLNSNKKNAEMEFKNIIGSIKLKFEKEKSKIIAANLRQIIGLPSKFTGNPEDVDLSILGSTRISEESGPPEISGIFGASTDTSNKFYPNMLMAILGVNFGETPGQVFLRYTKFDGTIMEVEMLRTHWGSDHYGPDYQHGPDWNPYVVLMRIPNLTGFLSQNVSIKLIRNDYEDATFNDIPLEPFVDFLQLSQQNAPNLSINVADGLTVQSDWSSSDDQDNGATLYASHTGIGNGTDTCELPRLKNGWKVLHASQHAYEPDLNVASYTITSRVLDNDDLVHFTIDWSVGALPSIPLIGGFLPIIGDITIVLKVLIMGPLDVPFQ